MRLIIYRVLWCSYILILGHSKITFAVSVYKPETFSSTNGHFIPKNPFMKTPDANVTQSSLQTYPLDALHLVGVIRQGSNVRALISLPTGKINTVKINNVIGNKKARVLRISDHSIEIEEINDSRGTLQKRIVFLSMR